MPGARSCWEYYEWRAFHVALRATKVSLTTNYSSGRHFVLVIGHTVDNCCLQCPGCRGWDLVAAAIFSAQLITLTLRK